MNGFRARVLVLVLSLFWTASARGDEGMWPFNLAPVSEVKQRTGFEMTGPWLDRVMRSSVRLSSYGSGAFVSGKGLILTNHHVVSTCIQKLAAKPGAPDFVQLGFLARKNTDELRCPDLSADVLVRIEDVTEQMKAATDKKAESAKLEKTCAEKSGHRCELVTLYAGAAHHLYELERHVDIRLVFAPESDVTLFGGDGENFNFPRHTFDVALLRVWDKNVPISSPNYFPFDKEGPGENELTFISGNPGATDRFVSVAKLELLRKTTYPFLIRKMGLRRDRLLTYAAKGEKERKAARDDLLRQENWIKAIGGYQRGLTDPKLINAAKAREKKVLDRIKTLKDPAQKKTLLEAWPKLAAAYKKHAQIYEQHQVLEGIWGPGGRLALFARHLVRASAELPKPNEERLREYRETALPALEITMTTEETIDEGLEIELVTFGLENIVGILGKEDRLVAFLLDGKTPRARAEEAVKGSKLKDVAVRKALIKGGKAAIDGANDPMIELVRIYDEGARAVRKTYEDEVENVEREWGGRIAEAYGAAFGTTLYPDATFTPRINFGFVKGYQEKSAKVDWMTTLKGMFVKNEMAGGQEPYRLPKRWLDAKKDLDLEQSLNFVTTNDIIIGSSGSPTFDRDGKLMGVVFDMNLSQLPNRFLYREDTQRSIHVHGVAILHVLHKVYGATELLRELL
jgi:hypothetical protein